MDTTCLVSLFQAGGGGLMMWAMFSWHFGSLNAINHDLNAKSLSELGFPKSGWDTAFRVVENNKAKILWGLPVPD